MALIKGSSPFNLDPSYFAEFTTKSRIKFYVLLAPELFFLILAHPVYKMLIIHEPNTLELQNKLHFEEKKTEYIPFLKYSVPIFVE